MSEVLARIQRGEADDRDLDTLAKQVVNVTDQNRCYLPVGSQILVGSTMQAFSQELTEVMRRGEPTPGGVPTPLIESIDEDTGDVEYHPRYHLKQLDWSYADQDPSSERLAAIREE